MSRWAGGWTAAAAAAIEYGRITHRFSTVTATAATGAGAIGAAVPLFDLSDFKRDLSELTDRLGQAQDCL